MIICNERYRIRREETGAFLYDSKTGNVFVANETATLICDLLKEQHSKESVIEHLSNSYAKQEIDENLDAITEFIDEAVKNEFFVEVS